MKIYPDCVGLNLWEILRKKASGREKQHELVKVTNKGKYVIFNYFWLQNLFLLMYRPNSWLP